MGEQRVALIPAYEPEPCLLELVRELHQRGMNLVVVDDGSSQEKRKIFQEICTYAAVLQHRKNQGKGRALKTGLGYISTHFSAECVVVTVDADGQHKPEDVSRVCEAAEEHPDCLILGSRRMKGKVPLRSKLGNTVTRLVYGLSTGTRVYDTQTGLRAFSISRAPMLMDVPGERYEYEMNMLLEFFRAGISIREVEIATVYIGENETSHFHAWKDSYRIYKEILKFSAASFTSFLLDYLVYGFFIAVTAGLGGSTSVLCSNAGARLVSAGFNYTVNRKMVFHSRENPVKSALQYGVLAGAILVGNTILLELFVNGAGINPYVGKLLTELLFFFVSWLIQSRFIFANRQPDNKAVQKG